MRKENRYIKLSSTTVISNGRAGIRPRKRTNKSIPIATMTIPNPWLLFLLYLAIIPFPSLVNFAHLENLSYANAMPIITTMMATIKSARKVILSNGSGLQEPW